MTDQERALLALEAKWWRHPGTKEQAIRNELDLSPTRYYQLLARLIHREDALAHDPVLINRLRRLASARFTTRQTPRLAS